MGDTAVADRPIGRYEKPRRTGRRRWWYWTILAAFVVAGVIVAYVGYENLGATPIDPEVSTYNVIDDHTIAFSFTVTRNHPDQAADCIAYALSADGDEAGREEIYVPPSGTSIQLNSRFQTDKRATTVEFYGCSYQVPAYLTKSMPPSG
ncbi:MAG TPA: DUF4307 domain-containing protein [Pseudonocardiaceae bacterium]|jgi:hypothetical protein|nr:DUF4307 domain-containing protein [Pseudonocardiaceae bacterium]